MNRVQVRRQVASVTLLLAVGCGTQNRSEPAAVPEGSGGQTADTRGIGAVVTTVPSRPSDTVRAVESASTVFTGDSSMRCVWRAVSWSCPW